MRNAKPGTRYRQIRATLTEEAGGYFTVRVLVKPVGSEWHHRQTVHVLRWRMSDPPGSLPGALDNLAGALTRLAGSEPSD